MEISLKIAELKGAERMVEIKSVHGSGLGTYREGSGSWGTIGIELLEALAETGLTFKVPYTTNVLGLDLYEWRNMGLPEDFANTQMRGITAFRRLGIQKTGGGPELYLSSLSGGKCAENGRSSGLGGNRHRHDCKFVFWGQVKQGVGFVRFGSRPHR
jgi:hypothetical protein